MANIATLFSGRSCRRAAAICLVGVTMVSVRVRADEDNSGDVLRLSMISGDGKRLLATINGETFAVGEKHKVMLGDRKVMVQCLGIHQSSAVVKVDGETTGKELTFGRRAKSLPAT